MWLLVCPLTFKTLPICMDIYTQVFPIPVLLSKMSKMLQYTKFFLCSVSDHYHQVLWSLQCQGLKLLYDQASLDLSKKAAFDWNYYKCSQSRPLSIGWGITFFSSFFPSSSSSFYVLITIIFSESFLPQAQRNTFGLLVRKIMFVSLSKDYPIVMCSIHLNPISFWLIR